MSKMIIASTSTIHGGDYLDYLKDELIKLFKNDSEILFIPYARPGGLSHSEYTEKAAMAFSRFNRTLKGIHEYENPVEALEKAQGIFTGGGNTFVLVSELYRNGLMATLRETILNGTPYLGTSAGSNICGLTMSTTNDMPIVYPPSFKTLGILPFNINPHYLDPDENSTHMGETRETRIREFHKFNNQPVVGLREGSWLEVNDEQIILKGGLKARIFERLDNIYEVGPGTDLTNLS
ncbi:MAG: dipeptidase PepE [Flavobacteriaceae bacterium]|nr:dipeptidase PepE [Flavobacteriaceae bacterium]